MKPGRIALILIILLLLGAAAYVVIHLSGAYEASAVMQESSGEEAAGTFQTTAQTTYTTGQAIISTSQAVDATSLTTDGIIGQPLQTTSPAISGETEGPALRLMAVGDIMLGRGVGMRLKKAGDYGIAFEKISDYLKQGDVVFANLESPITSSTHSLDKKRKIVLKGDPASVSALTGAGISVVSLANNHMMDYYEKGLFDTMDILDKNNILHIGSGRNMDDARKPAIIEKNGIKIGFLAYSDMAELVFAGDPYLKYSAEADKSGVLPRKYETIKEDVEKLRSQVDILAVSLHWGVEESFTIPPEQVEFAHKLIDGGVDIILGHHPHQFQGIEMYKGKPIIYSMGNFLFDQNDPENMESFIMDIRYEGSRFKSCTAIPVRILDKSYVEVQTGAAASNILERETELCRKLGTGPETVNDTLVFK
ncbi:MAG TPA: CapA family protein [Clostridia bacterium]|nr:CapA family protein [Clostridia bacterium]